MDDHDPKEELPIHVVLGANEFSKIKIKEVPIKNTIWLDDNITWK